MFSMKTLAYQGVHGAYGEKAVNKLGLQPIPYSTFTKCVNMAENGDVDAALLPIENTTEGDVGEANDLLLSTTLNILSEIYLPISHCLIGTGLEKDVTTVYSHQQALGQCRKMLANKITISINDTAEAVKLVKKLDDKCNAAIASSDAANIYNVPIIREHVNDVSENYTRFVMLGHGKTKPTGNDKTTIRFKLANEPRALYSVLGVIGDVNLSRIESRPLKTGKWEYYFLVDFVGYYDDQNIVNILKQLETKTDALHIIGSYPSFK